MHPRNVYQDTSHYFARCLYEVLVQPFCKITLSRDYNSDLHQIHLINLVLGKLWALSQLVLQLFSSFIILQQFPQCRSSEVYSHQNLQEFQHLPTCLCWVDSACNFNTIASTAKPPQNHNKIWIPTANAHWQWMMIDVDHLPAVLIQIIIYFYHDCAICNVWYPSKFSTQKITAWGQRGFERFICWTVNLLIP